MSDGKLSSRPPSMGDSGKDSLAAFIGGAGVHTPEPTAAIAATPETLAPVSYTHLPQSLGRLDADGRLGAAGHLAGSDTEPALCILRRGGDTAGGGR